MNPAPDAASAGADTAVASPPPSRVLVVDDESPMLRALGTNLRARGYHVDLAPTGEEALQLAARHRPDAVILDLGLPGISGITKPFGMDELLARLRAALRRIAPAPESALVDTADFTVDLAAKKVTGPDGEVRLTPTEWGLVEVLVRNAGKLVSQRQLLQDVWGPQYGEETNYLRVHMAHIRRKLEPDPSRPRYFITEPGMGYRFEGPEV